MQEISVTSRAYPTVGIILLGGISDKDRRIPRHTSAGFAYTGLDDEIFVETRLFSSSMEAGYINGDRVDLSGSRSPFKLINRYRGLIARNNSLEEDKVRLSFESRNVGVLSGSSDGAAAAIGKCVEGLCRQPMEWNKFENELRMISESVGRSVYGGLTITREAELPYTEKLLDADSFRDYVIVGCRFNTQRKPSDRIHENVVKSPEYGKRVENTRKKGEKLQKLAEENDVKGIFELAMSDTDEYHRLIESVGVHVITPEMRTFIERVKEMRSGAWMSYIVTGGSNVFVPVEKKNYKMVMEEALKYDSDPVPLKVAKGANLTRG
ncbi:hypothetical protein IX51_06055 [uncultured archaeon]|nr:hypothetical protein IX51_06055 [uncultured archaeon]